ncbi:MAG TPA: HWE histidine kinase domain-containing protein [Alphaproteobacteria bacterium]|nr:HWE histidine kinase domain-containing protein [Alphaproteobacteria bacterium]
MLLYEPDRDFRNLLCEVSSKANWSVSATGKIDDFVRWFESLNPSIVMITASMPPISDVHAVQWLADRRSDATVIISYSSFDPALNLAKRLNREGRLSTLHMMQRPFRISELREILKMSAAYQERALDQTSQIIPRPFSTTSQPSASADGAEPKFASHDGQAWLAGQKEAFQRALNNADLASSLAPLITTITNYFEDRARCAFFIANADSTAIHHVIGMPAGYAKAIDGFKIGADSIACGLAAHSGRGIVTPDVFIEPLWKDLVWVARLFKFRGCWSFPIETSNGRIVGTFAIYHDEPRTPIARDFALVEAMTVAGGIIIAKHQERQQRDRAEHALSDKETHLETALEAQEMLTAEMDHRVKNVFMLLQNMIRASRQSATSTDDLAEKLSGRLKALAAAHALVHRAFSPLDAAPRVTELKELLEVVLRPHSVERNAAPATFVLTGPRIDCVERAVNSLALIFHELATNAAKYGALSDQGGKILIDWKVEEDTFALKWREIADVPAQPSPSNPAGFGKSLIDTVVYRQLGGRIEQQWTGRGIKIELSLPMSAIADGH